LYVLHYGAASVAQLSLSGGVESARIDPFADIKAKDAQAKNADGLAFDKNGKLYVTAGPRLYQISADGKTIMLLGGSSSANVEFGAGPLNCMDIYTAGGGLKRYTNDTAGLDVPWHRQ